MNQSTKKAGERFILDLFPSLLCERNYVVSGSYHTSVSFISKIQSCIVESNRFCLHFLLLLTVQSDIWNISFMRLGGRAI